ncbi:MAG: hypothetical protein ACJ72N_17405 [Labedaea sp.]
MTQTRTPPGVVPGVLNLRVGELVEVRSAEEILATLDERGELENLPFMPEMLAYCGQRLSVHKVAHKVCDTLNRTGMRKMSGAVHLTGARCSGEEHGGCQTACSLYWKEQWLRRVAPDDPPAGTTGLVNGHSKGIADGRALLPLLVTNARKPDGPDGDERFSCQATELLRAAPVCLSFLDVSQYVRDVRSGNVGPVSVFRTFLVGLFNRLQRRATKVLPRKLWFREGLRWRFLKGGVTGRTPTAHLDLRPGELVRIRSKEDIVATLDENLLNRGMGFDEEMSSYCGQTYRVQSRVERCIDEKTGRMLTMKSPCIVLDGVVCRGVYNSSCPREFVPFWREIWLERV